MHLECAKKCKTIFFQNIPTHRKAQNVNVSSSADFNGLNFLDREHELELQEENNSLLDLILCSIQNFQLYPAHCILFSDRGQRELYKAIKYMNITRKPEGATSYIKIPV